MQVDKIANASGKKRSLAYSPSSCVTPTRNGFGLARFLSTSRDSGKKSPSRHGPTSGISNLKHISDFYPDELLGSNFLTHVEMICFDLREYSHAKLHGRKFTKLLEELKIGNFS